VPRLAHRNLRVPLQPHFAARLRRSPSTIALVAVRVIDPDGRSRDVALL
jgi:hypothetical protein